MSKRAVLLTFNRKSLTNNAKVRSSLKFLLIWYLSTICICTVVSNSYFCFHTYDSQRIWPKNGGSWCSDKFTSHLSHDLQADLFFQWSIYCISFDCSILYLQYWWNTDYYIMVKFLQWTWYSVIIKVCLFMVFCPSLNFLTGIWRHHHCRWRTSLDHPDLSSLDT